MLSRLTPQKALLAALTAVCCCLRQPTTGTLQAEDPPAAKPPRIALLSPLGVIPGQTNRLLLRGWALKDATALSPDSPAIQITVVSHASATIPGKQKAEQIGDEQLELDIVVPADHATGQMQLLLRTAAGESAPRRVPVGSSLPLLQEQEPNDGFRNAQQVNIPQVINGSIHADTNVDVYAFEILQPVRLLIQVEAAALGSNLDALLTLLRDDGSILLSHDDNRNATDTATAAAAAPTPGNSTEAPQRDARLLVNLQPGRYLVTLQDAHDRGGPAHPYRLTLQTTDEVARKDNSTN